MWLKSGETISGTMTNEEAIRLKQWAKSLSQEPEEFNDTDGLVIIRPERVEAVAINDSIELRKIGF